MKEKPYDCHVTSILLLEKENKNLKRQRTLLQTQIAYETKRREIERVGVDCVRLKNKILEEKIGKLNACIEILEGPL